MAHHPNCADFRGLDPGFAEATGNPFIERYRDRFDGFPVDTYTRCLGCCLAYLTRDRNYTRRQTQQPGLFYVHFPTGDPPNPYRIPGVTCFAQKPQGSMGAKGQIATGHDVNLGDPYCRPFQASRTYQLYVPHDGVARGLSIGFPCNARMESVAIDVVDQEERGDISDIKLNFADAMLVERYKEMSQDGDAVNGSFAGYCMTPAPGEAEPPMKELQKLAINE